MFFRSAEFILISNRHDRSSWNNRVYHNIFVGIIFRFILGMKIGGTKNQWSNLTKNQLEFLMDTHERALLKQPPLTIYNTKVSKGLIFQGLIEARPFQRDKKLIMGLFITQVGINLLDTL